jgi:DNA gyrase subunit A
LLIATRTGQVMQLSFSSFRTPSTKAGRRFCRLRERDCVVFVELVRDAKTTVFLATRDARVIHFKIDDVPILGGAGKGVRGIKLAPNDEVLGAIQLGRPGDSLHVINANDKPLSFGQMKYGITSRGGKGIKTSTRTGFKELVSRPIELVDWEQYEESKS